jgi:hypothetical protein
VVDQFGCEQADFGFGQRVVQGITDRANGRLGQGWRSELADPDGRGIRVGFLSQPPLDRVAQVREFLPPLRPVQVDDTDTTISQMGRPCCTSKSSWPGDRWIWFRAI